MTVFPKSVVPEACKSPLQARKTLLTPFPRDVLLQEIHSHDLPVSIFHEKGVLTNEDQNSKTLQKRLYAPAVRLWRQDGQEPFDGTLRYRSSLQNDVIDTGNEVILVDTGMPLEAPDMVVDEKTQIFISTRIKDSVSAVRELGYQTEQVSKSIVPHKHADHTGDLRSFPNAKIYAYRGPGRRDQTVCQCHSCRFHGWR